MQPFSKLCVAAALFSSTAGAVEIATGKMLGAGYDARAFYLRQSGAQWRKTYTGPQYRPEAAGRLMNLRVAQALFHDEWLTEQAFDPDLNTTRAIEALDNYKAHGILAISVSLQGGQMQYELRTGIKRLRSAKLGPGKGALMSAFRPDGSMKPEWLERALRLARELDRRGMILNLMYIYAHQDEVFSDTVTIDRAVANATDWVIGNNLRNVIIEIANEHDNSAFDHDRYVPDQIGKLIDIARERFTAKKAAFRVPITASTGSSMAVFNSVRDRADLTAIHGNRHTPEAKGKRTAELFADKLMPGPIYMNEDDNGRDSTPANLKLELASCDAVFRAGGSWGYMPWRQLQIFPFRFYRPSAGTHVTDEMHPDERDPAYFNLVLKHIRGLLFKDPR